MNNIVRYEDNVNQLAKMADVFLESGMFKDVKSQAQAIVKIQAGQELGLEPFAAMQGIDIIQGKAVPNSGLQANLIKGSGKYNYKVKEHTDKVCTLEFYERWDGQWEAVGLSTYTQEEATKAGIAFKDNWKKHPKNMLFARALSNGCKWFCADVFNGASYNESDADQIEYQAVEAVDNSGVEALKSGNLRKLVKEEPVDVEEKPEVIEATATETKVEAETTLADDAIEALRACATRQELIALKDSIKASWGLSEDDVAKVGKEFVKLQKEMISNGQ